MELSDGLRIVGGLVLLVVGGELLVKGATSLARRMGMSTLLVGLTIVAVATSAPELAVSLDAVRGGRPDVAVGNVVGSNTVNSLLVVGVTALVARLSVERRLVKLDLPIMVGIGVLFVALAFDGRISPLDGAILLACFVAQLVLGVVVARREARAEEPARAEGAGDGASEAGGDATSGTDASLSLPLALVALVAGVGLLVVGADLLVQGAVGAATALGVSGLVVGLTIVAVGTSLPEIASSIAAVRHGEHQLVLGGVVGSNIANIGLVLGLPALIPPADGGPAGIPVPSAVVALDAPLMLAAMVALLPVAFTGYVIGRREGVCFVALYAAYLAYVVLAASQHDALAGFTSVMAWFVLPLLALVGVGVVSYELGLRRARGSSHPSIR